MVICYKFLRKRNRNLCKQLIIKPTYVIMYKILVKRGRYLLRNEIKYLLTYEEYLILSARIRAVLPMDKHASDPSGYVISSLYLDDQYNSSYYEKIAGTANRSKYRLRAYNFDDSYITLECKEKHKNMIQKESVRIDRATYDTIMTSQQIADAILTEFTSDPDLYPNLSVDGNISGDVVALSTSTGVTITATIFATTAATEAAIARVEMERGISLVRSAVFTDSSQEGLVDATVGYIARILYQLNHQAGKDMAE